MLCLTLSVHVRCRLDACGVLLISVGRDIYLLGFHEIEIRELLHCGGVVKNRSQKFKVRGSIIPLLLIIADSGTGLCVTPVGIFFGKCAALRKWL